MEIETIKKVVDEVVRELANRSFEKPVENTIKSSIEETKPSFSRGRKLANENIAKWLGKPYLEEKLKTKPTVSPIKTSIPEALKPHSMQEIISSTPARIGVWRAGTRYLTKIMLKLRGDHAIAKDAVYAELNPGFAESNGWIRLETKAKTKDEFLLRPDLGRQLDDKSLQIVREKGIKNPDIQIILADGLSAWAAERNGKPMAEELIRIFAKEGLTVGTIFCVHYSRIAIQDVIGEAVNAKVSMILLGERPGLGSGDSLSNYMIYGPKVGAVNAKKSMISNIHPTGIKPLEAAALTVSMVKKMFEQGCSGIDLKI